MLKKTEERPFHNVVSTLEETGQFEGERSSSERLSRNIRRLTAILLIAAVAVIVSGIYLYQRSGAWQTLIPPLAAGLNIILCFVARRAVRLEKHAAAGKIVLATMAMFFASIELAYSGTSITVAAAGFSAIILTGVLALPRKWRIWLVTASSFGFLILALDQLELYRRYFSARSPLLGTWIPGFGIALVAALLIHLGSALYRPTIRARLLIAFAAMVILLAAIVGAGAVLTAVPRIERQVTSQLESVATLKEAAITTWVDTLEIELSTVLAGSEQLRSAILLAGAGAPDTEEYKDSYRALHDHLRTTAALTGRFDEIALINLDGMVILSTDPKQEGKSHANEAYFAAGLRAPYTHTPTYSPALATNMVMSVRPIKNQAGETVALLAGRAGMELPTTIMQERSGMGESGATFLVGVNHALLTKPISGESGRLFGFSGETDRVYAYTQGVNAAIDDRRSGSGSYENIDGVQVIGVYRWLPELQVALIAEQNEEEALRAVDTMVTLIVGLTAGLVLVAIVSSVLITNSIAKPIRSLSDTAQAIATGDRERVARVIRQDEVGALATAFNSMTRQLRELIDSLEKRVSERTREVERRSAYLEAAGEVAGAVSRILDPDELIRQVVNLIQERFGLYYVGLFLVNPDGEWADLRAGTGEAGRAMLQRGHRISIGKGMVGWSIAQGEARIALEAGEDSVQLRSAELPRTRSEAAIPLRSRGQILGALSVQDTRPNAFDQEGIALLQTMADQVAVALDNAQLFAQSEAALQIQRRAFGELRATEWMALQRIRPDWGYRYTSGVGDGASSYRVTSVDSDWQPLLGQAVKERRRIQSEAGDPVIAVPIQIEDLTVGALQFRKTAAENQWTEEEIEVLEAMADQLGIALENARLYQQTQMRAAREQLSGELGTRLRQSLDVETVLRTAAQEVREVLDLPEVIVRLVPRHGNGSGDKNQVVEQ
jgi:GAF domain-containing protein/HAMP domain-containing protein